MEDLVYEGSLETPAYVYQNTLSLCRQVLTLLSRRSPRNWPWCWGVELNLPEPAAQVRGCHGPDLTSYVWQHLLSLVSRCVISY